MRNEKSTPAFALLREFAIPAAIQRGPMPVVDVPDGVAVLRRRHDGQKTGRPATMDPAIPECPMVQPVMLPMNINATAMGTMNRIRIRHSL